MSRTNRIIISIIVMLWVCGSSACREASLEDWRKTAEASYRNLPESEKQSLIEQLHDAANKGDDETVRKTLARGVPVDAHPLGWWTPLMEAASKGHYSTVQLLISRGADVNARNDVGMTALMIAAINKRPEIVRLLIESHADVNIKDNAGHTALYHAQVSFNQESVDLITKAGGTSELSAEFYERLKKSNKTR